MKILNTYHILKEKFEDTKGVIRNHISKIERQYNGQNKKDNDLQAQRKLKIEHHQPPTNLG
jgi:hypothetical protein